MSILPKASRRGDWRDTRCRVPKFRGADSAAPSIKLARDGVTSTNTGEHFPKRVENALRCGAHLVDVVIVDVRTEHCALGGGMCAVGSDVDAEVFVMFRIGEAVMSFQPVDLRFTNRGNLTFVGVERGQTFGGRSFAAD